VTFRVYRSALPRLFDQGSVCALGFFDGVHLGHQMVMETARREARRLGVPAGVVSFDQHPQQIISRTPTPLLSTLDERLALFAEQDMDFSLILPFTEAMKSMSAKTFVTAVLMGSLNAQALAVGYDYRFGAQRRGDAAFLRQCAQNVTVLDPVRVPDDTGASVIVSSTLIRKLLSYGDLALANRLLGRPYALTGTVVHGLARGRQLGFPTANLALAPQRLLPAAGVYAGLATVNGHTYSAVCNVGVSPTFADQAHPRVEVHLLGYDGGDCYGHVVQFDCVARLRGEQTFPTVDALVAQMTQDCQQAERALQGSNAV
jgi:riboflavin kinase/FMN adenylyltransferase